MNRPKSLIFAKEKPLPNGFMNCVGMFQRHCEQLGPVCGVHDDGDGKVVTISHEYKEGPVKYIISYDSNRVIKSILYDVGVEDANYRVEYSRFALTDKSPTATTESNYLEQ